MRVSSLVCLDSTRPSLLDLPTELVTAIYALVDCRSVVQCRAVCRRLRDVVDASVEVQYRIELVRDGMVDGGGKRGPALPLLDRLARLRELRRAWRTLDWRACVTVPMPGPCCAYELVGGMFCKTQPRATRRPTTSPRRAGFSWGPWPAVWSTGDDPVDDWDDGAAFGARTLSATWLPGRHVPARTVVTDDLGLPTRDFAMDPGQDVIVLFKGGGEETGLPIMGAFPGVLELHVRTISENGTHPEARVPVLSARVTYPVASVFVQIVDDVVGMMYHADPARPRIAIWNWKSGDLVVDRNHVQFAPGTWDFSFIHSRALCVTTSNGGGSLELFTFACEPRAAGAESSSSSSRERPAERAGASSLTHVASLHLPPILPSTRVLSVGSHTGPFLAGCPPGKPFMASNEERIHVLTVQYVQLATLDGQRTRPRVCVFVHNRTLEAYLKQGAASPRAVPWTEWGRARARVLPHAGVFQWLRYVHGQRVVMISPGEPGKSTLQVLDFNVRGAFDEGDGDDGDGGGKTVLKRVDSPTRIVMSNIFVDAVESGLPYREACRDVEGDYSGVMIDEERLVGLKYPAFLTGDMKEIDVFTM